MADLEAWWRACREIGPDFRAPKFKTSSAGAIYAALDATERNRLVTDVCREWVTRRASETNYAEYLNLAEFATTVVRSPGQWSSAEAQELVDAVAGEPARPVSNYELPIHKIAVAVAATGGVDPRSIDALDAIIDCAGHPQGDTNKLRLRLRALSKPAGHVSLGDDGWSAVVRSRLGADPPAILVALLSSCGANPTAKWRRSIAEALRADASAATAVRAMVAALPVAVAEAEVGFDGSALHFRPPLCEFYEGPNAETVRGAIRAVAWLERGAAEVDRLEELALLMATWPGGKSALARGEKLANAAIAALGDIATTEATAALSTLKRRIKNRTVAKVLARVVGEVAERSGVSPEELAEAAVPDSDPTATTKAARSALADERFRIEGLLITDRVWEPLRWIDRYRGHQLRRWFGERLLWEFLCDGRWIAAFPDRDDPETARTIDGDRIDVRASQEVRLWHPHEHAVADIAGWRRWLLERQVVQPFKQVFREIYLLTPAEEETASYSLRFAAEVVKVGPLLALLRERRWSGQALGPWNSGEAAVATRTLSDEWRISMAYEGPPDRDPPALTPVATIGRVWFEQRAAGSWTVASLKSVPARLFSEGMRDIDLFVGVASIGLDPTWGIEQPYDHRWVELAFAELTPAGLSRRDALERLLPRTTIADRCTLTDRWLNVRGDLASYRIHLGSANVQLEANSQYLCIVPERRAKPDMIYLPFEEDGGTLSLILSKAFLLADDRSIKDKSILAQIAGLQPVVQPSAV